MCVSVMTCAEGIVKFLVAGANFIFALGGLALIAVGVLYKINFDNYVDVIPGDYEAIGLAPILTIVIGAIIFIIAFFGCCGALRENSCMLTTYAVILLIIFLLQIAVGVFVFVEIKNKDDLKTEITTHVEKFFHPVTSGEETTNKGVVDIIQSELKCCGASSASEWESNIPPSCYGTPNVTTTLYTEGCAQALYDFLVNSMQIIGIVVLTLSALEVIGSVFSLCLSSSIKNRERRFRY